MPADILDPYGGGDILFGRVARLIIAVPVATPGDFSSVTLQRIEINGSDNVDSPGERVRFKVTKTNEKHPNTAEITISNLSQASRDALQTKGVKVLLEAGYETTGVSRMFRGDMRTSDHMREVADWNTVLKCGDGERAFRFARANESFEGGTTAGQVLRYLADQLGLPVGNAREVADQLSFRFDNGYVVSGSAQASIDRLIKSLGLSWSIQDESLQVLRPGQALGLSVPELSPETGLIGSPEMGAAEKKGKPQLCKFKSFLLATRPGAKVLLRSKRYHGTVVVKKLEHEGDTAGGEWYTTIEGVLHAGS